MEKLVEENRRFNYYLPVINKNKNELFGNIVVTVDYQKYFHEIFSVFNLKDYQWQWVSAAKATPMLHGTSAASAPVHRKSRRDT